MPRQATRPPLQPQGSPRDRYRDGPAARPLRSVFKGVITVLMTHTATTFLPAHTVALAADRVVTGGEAATWPRDNHATLAAGHDLMMILPATANFLSVAASGQS